ncbi:MAG: hypothetical protein V4677_12625 [Bacteroidota bacterium]
MNDQTPREILSRFYADNNLDADGGQASSFVKIEMTRKFHFYFPNFDARRKAVILHDIHHLITDYTTTLAGESEISAWEIGSGCKSYWAAFLIDTSGLMVGIPFNFFGVLKAFARGRRTKNLYHNTISLEEAMDMNVSELKKVFYLDVYDKNTKPRVTDFLLFGAFAMYGTLFSLATLVLFPFIMVYSLYIFVKTK